MHLSISRFLVELADIFHEKYNNFERIVVTALVHS